MKLTTQQAADLLGVSRPTVVRLITDGTLPAERIGNRHRLLLDDVLAYREERRNRQYEALAATAVDIDAEDDLEVLRQRLREARRSSRSGGEPTPRRAWRPMRARIDRVRLVVSDATLARVRIRVGAAKMAGQSWQSGNNAKLLARIVESDRRTVCPLPHSTAIK